MEINKILLTVVFTRTCLLATINHAYKVRDYPYGSNAAYCCGHVKQRRVMNVARKKRKHMTTFEILFIYIFETTLPKSKPNKPLDCWDCEPSGLLFSGDSFAHNNEVYIPIILYGCGI